jgi:predicted nucleic acid-binding protein
MKLPDLVESRGPGDNPLSAMAVSGQAAYLVSGDKQDVLTLKKTGAARIVTARRFPNVREGKKP